MSSKKQGDVDVFLAQFNVKRDAMKTKLATFDEVAAGAPSPEVLERFNSVIDDYEALKKLFNEANIFLPSYHSKVAQDSLKVLWSEIDRKKDIVKPRKKFAFKKAEPNKPATIKVAGDEVDRATLKFEDTARTIATEDMTFAYGLRDKQNEELTLSGSHVENNDLQFVRLVNCTIEVMGSASTVHLKNLEGCKISLGPVKTSVFVSDCINCVFKISGQQLRIHTSKDCDFFVSTSSKPIIEDCSSLRFGQYSYSYEGIETDFAKSGSDQSACYWNEVVDFCWLSTESPSPNWTLIN